jgi:hypothetical protein
MSKYRIERRAAMGGRGASYVEDKVFESDTQPSEGSLVDDAEPVHDWQPVGVASAAPTREEVAAIVPPVGDNG